MYLPFVCNKCSKDKWMVIYDTEQKGHALTCANCGYKSVLEDVMSGRSPKQVVIRKPAVTQSNEVKHDVAVQ